ncbi:uncharacterized protein BX663DRAFT_513168 [Cokeromyces recurvatus]|uniref:uncharacterized protein n=1 Tax=Cokeromyces recurvatus TaxID=90255 RepID=UPI00221E4A84|nr:uncharacterized protein BX663DRAFT_513168 [Cokeromyces recurvatus]KAI7901996.1 hypothetical protein BX663DRAFT_513168 [Cokeromyces recurvatus]
MGEMYTENNQLYLRIQQDPLWSHSNSDGESPLTSPSSTDLIILASTKTTPTLHFYENDQTTTKIKVDEKRLSRLEEVDLYSTMYHQHLVVPNESIVCIKPENIMLQDYPSTTTTKNKKTIIIESDTNQDKRMYSKKRKQCELDMNYSLLEEGLEEEEEEEEGKDRIKMYKSNCYHQEIIEEEGFNKKRKSNNKKRTITSYDSQTSFYLKSVFFEVYSCQSKLTKQQRLEVQRKTGLPPRNITYWFSNHKRRFQNTLKIYRKIVNEANGKIKNYHDFINWRKEHGLPEQISQEEVKQLEDNDAEQK